MRTEFDLVIVGGGINGAALARLAAAQGLSVGLFEGGDFGQGASTATSKMIHGGLRYLERMDLSLVGEAVRERAHLRREAPHLVEEKRFLFPLSGGGRRGRWPIKAGLTLYDFLAGALRLEPHRYVPPAELARREPRFLGGRPCAAYSYSDCLMDDSRLVLENVLDARRLGAEVFNYHRFLEVEEGGEEGMGRRGPEARVLDRLNRRELLLRCRHLAFTLGPWTDAVAGRGFKGSTAQLQLSQGTHMVVERLPVHSCFILPVPGSRRYFFLLPWKRYHLIGTTEVEVPGEPPEVSRPLDLELEELRALMAHYFPGVELRLICAFSGVRPLARGKAGPGGTVRLSREHQFRRLGQGVYTVVGGKYTTHRPLVREYLGYILGRPPEPQPERLLPGAWREAGEAEELRRRLLALPFGDDESVGVWMERYGRRCGELAEYIAADPARARRLPGRPILLAGEVLFAIEREMAKCPLDFFRRRTDIFFTPGGGLEALEEVEALFRRTVPGYRSLEGEVDYREYLRICRHGSIAG